MHGVIACLFGYLEGELPPGDFDLIFHADILY